MHAVPILINQNSVIFNMDKSLTEAQESKTMNLTEVLTIVALGFNFVALLVDSMVSWTSMGSNSTVCSHAPCGPK